MRNLSDHVRRIYRGRRAERGQMLIVVAMILIPLTAAVGVIAVDMSTWQSERRGAQKDADYAALAGAYELLDTQDLTTADEARAAANAYQDKNDEAGNAEIANNDNLNDIIVDNSCFNSDLVDLDSVKLNVRHKSRTFFGEVFGIKLAPDIGAHARACAGSLISSTGNIPIEIDNDPGPCFDNSGTPNYTALCPLEFGSHDANPRGVIDLEASGPACSNPGGSGDLYNLILNGTAASCDVSPDNTCHPSSRPWRDCVAVQAGNAKKIVDGFADRIKRETNDGCDTNHNGVDEFTETVTKVFDTGNPATSQYEAKVCPTSGKISPRIITIFVLDHNPPTNSGNTGFPIQAFAAFYIKGCAFDNQPVTVDDLDPECAAKNKFGHVVIWGDFVRLIVAGGEVGAPNPSSTLSAISLTE